jgi:regulator of protease activity HflC (stomatin/prohibitin superfamily)
LTITCRVHYRHYDEKENIMADITKFWFLRHLRATPTAYIRHTAKGKVVHAGVGAAFWFLPLSAAVSEIPVDDREQPLVFHARTVDFQDVTVQASITYRVQEPETASARIDFGIDPETGGWRARPLEQVGDLLTQLAQQQALTVVAQLELRAALADGMAAVRASVAAGLRGDERISQTGLTIVDVRVVALRAEAEVERALQTPLREQVRQDADRATYERRAVAVERERAIAENEMQSKIELARREEQLVDQKGRNDRKRATEVAAAEQIEAQAQAERRRLLAAADAEATTAVGLATAAIEAAALAPYRDLDQAIVFALAVKQLAANLPAIGTLNITPDVLTQLAGKLAGESR